MSYYDEQLQQLQQQIIRKKQLKNMLADLRYQHQAVIAEVKQLNEIKLEEQSDVKRLEGRSLAAFFYGVIGKMGRKLTQERREAYQASVKYDMAARQLHLLRKTLKVCRNRYTYRYTI